MNNDLAPYIERASEQRASDFRTVRAWVFEQIDSNMPQFAHDIACMLCSFDTPNWREADANAVADMRGRMQEAIEAQAATRALAERLRDDEEEEAREAEREATEDAAYARRCEESIPNIPFW